ncbi:MAG: amino acid permease, partial [Actinomycetota bacterium]|nr:amino acid permease [Actinomycetota bacterium]
DYPNTSRWIFVTYSVIIALHLLLNMLSIRVNNMLNTISAWWHMAGVLVIAAILFIVPDQHASAGFVFTETINNSGFSGENFSDAGFWFVFGLGLLMAQYTITGFDASAHLSEETRNASRGAAIGMVMSVVVSVIFGFIILLAVTFAVTDVPGTLEQFGFAVQHIWQTAVGDTWTKFLLLIACVAQFFCGNASVTSASRMLFAFSRDRAVPGHQLWRRVAGDRVPVFAVVAIVVLAWALMLPTLSNAVIGYAVGTSIAVIGLYIAFVLPIILRWRAGESFERGSWHLGRHYRWIDPVAIAWIALICVLFLMPLFPDGFPWSEGPLNWNDVNYAPLTVGGALVLFGGWYVLSARKWFKGPVRMTDEEVAARERAFGEAGPGIAPAGK